MKIVIIGNLGPTNFWRAPLLGARTSTLMKYIEYLVLQAVEWVVGG